MDSTSLFRQYFTTSMIAGSGRILKILAGITVIAFLNLIAGKDAFGLFIIAYAIVFMTAIAIETFFQSLILYHASRAEEDADMDGVAILGVALYWGAGLAVLAGLGLYSAAPWLESLLGHDGLAAWLRVLAPFLPAHVLLALLTAAYRARHNVATMALYFDVYPSLLLMGLTGCIWLAGGSVFLVGWAHTLAFLIPFAALFAAKPLKPPRDWRGLRRWDIGYGLKSMAVYIANQPMLGLDVLLVGHFCDVATTAEYAMAARFAQVLMLPKTAIAQLQVPRMGRFLKTGQSQTLQKEYEAMQDIALLATVFGVLCYVLLAQPVMNLLGDYDGAYTVLLVLSTASIIQAGFGASGNYLVMAGYAGWLFITNIFALCVLLVAMITLVPLWQGMGAGYALAIHALAMMGSVNYVIARQDGLHLMRAPLALYLGAVVLILFGGGQNVLGMSATALLLCVSSAAYLFCERRSIRFFRAQP